MPAGELTDVTDQLSGRRRAKPLSKPEHDFVSCWKQLIDQAGGGSQARAAKRLRWTTSTVSRDCKGETLPTHERLDQLCKLLGLPSQDALDLAALLRRARDARAERLKADDAPGETGQAYDLPWRPSDARPEPAHRQDGPWGRPGEAPPLGRWRRRLWPAVGLVAGVAGIVAAVTAYLVPGTGPGPGGPPQGRTDPAARAPYTVLGAYPGLAPKTVPIPVASLTSSLAAAFRQGRTAGHATITGFVIRNSQDSTLCLSPDSTAPTAGENRDPVVVAKCSGAASEIWIPEQWEISGKRFTHLVNDQYQSMCLNADNIGGLGDGHGVQLWQCYPAGNESWDFGDWQQHVNSGRNSYPIFAESGRLCLDADKYDFRVGDRVHVWTQYPVAVQFWT